MAWRGREGAAGGSSVIGVRRPDALCAWGPRRAAWWAVGGSLSAEQVPFCPVRRAEVKALLTHHRARLARPLVQGPGGHSQVSGESSEWGDGVGVGRGALDPAADFTELQPCAWHCSRRCGCGWRGGWRGTGGAGAEPVGWCGTREGRGGRACCPCVVLSEPGAGFRRERPLARGVARAPASVRGPVQLDPRGLGPDGRNEVSAVGRAVGPGEGFSVARPALSSSYVQRGVSAHTSGCFQLTCEAQRTPSASAVNAGLSPPAPRPRRGDGGGGRSAGFGGERHSGRSAWDPGEASRDSVPAPSLAPAAQSRFLRTSPSLKPPLVPPCLALVPDSLRVLASGPRTGPGSSDPVSRPGPATLRRPLAFRLVGGRLRGRGRAPSALSPTPARARASHFPCA